MKNVITDFGATGNGSTDDTAAIQTALNACSSGGAFPGVKLLFPAGTYKVTGTLNLTYDNYNLSGEGPSASIISYSGALNTLANGIFYSPNDATNRSGFVFDGLRMTSNTAGGSVYGILVSGSGTNANWRINNCKFDGFFAGGLRAANGMDTVTIDTCEFTNNGTAAMTGSNPTTASINGKFSNTVVRGCNIHDTGQLSTLNHAVYMNGGCKNVSIFSNTFARCGFDACAFGTSSDGFSGAPQEFGLAFSNNLCVDTIGAACNVSDSSAVVVSNNTVVTSNPAGQVCFKFGPVVYGWTLSNNVVSSTVAASASNGPTLVQVSYNASNGVISNNTASYTQGFDNYYFNGSTCIILSGAEDLEIFGNTISGYGMAIGVFSNNGGTTQGVQNSAKRINIHDNNLAIYPNSLDRSGNGIFIGNGFTPVGIIVNGYSRDIYIRNNTFRNFGYGVAITNQSNLVLAPAYSTTNISMINNRFYNTTLPLWVLPSATVNGCVFENNDGDVNPAVLVEGGVQLNAIQNQYSIKLTPLYTLQENIE